MNAEDRIYQQLDLLNEGQQHLMQTMESMRGEVRSATERADRLERVLLNGGSGEIYKLNTRMTAVEKRIWLATGALFLALMFLGDDKLAGVVDTVLKLPKG